MRHSTSAEHQVLQPVKHVELWTVCLKSCTQEKKSMMHQDSLSPEEVERDLSAS